MESEAGILQNRVEVAAFERRIDNPQERIRGREDEKLKGGGDPGLHGKGIGFQLHRQITAEGGNQRAEQGEDEDPQHHRAFVVSPDAGEAIHQRHRRIRVLVDVEHGEIGGDVASGERGERKRDEGKLRERRRRGDADERLVVGAGADDRHRTLDQR